MNLGGEEGCHYLLGFLKTHPPICTLRDRHQRPQHVQQHDHMSPQLAFSHPLLTSHTDTATTKPHQMECQTHYDAFSCLPTEGKDQLVYFFCVFPLGPSTALAWWNLKKNWETQVQASAPSSPCNFIHITSPTRITALYHDCSFK